MTSLARQLGALRGPTTKSLGVEKKHPSLLFERGEAEQLDRETIHKIGLKGLLELKKLDRRLEELDGLFDEANINFQRVLINEEENETLRKNIEMALVLLSPYMQHFSCQQALELLVYRYQIHTFDAEFFLTSFLPYHETNFFGRILSILDLSYATKEFAFLEEFAKKSYSVPFKMIAKYAASGSNSLLTRLAAYADLATKLTGEEWFNSHCTSFFAFHAKVLMSLFDSTTYIDDNLLSKIIPNIANGLQSACSSLRSTAMMALCKLVISAKLTESTTLNLLKILFLKIKENDVLSSLSTIIVICQQQKYVESFSHKAVLKVLRRDQEINFFKTLSLIGQKTDLEGYLIPFWKTLLELLDMDEEIKSLANEGFLKSMELVSTSSQMKGLVDLIADLIATSGKLIPSNLAASIYSLCSRYPVELDEARKEWESRDKKAFQKLTDLCNLKPLFLQVTKKESKIKRRRRSRSRTSVSESTELPNNNTKGETVDVLSQMQQESSFAKRKNFVGDPLLKAIEWIDKDDWENFEWALDEMEYRPNYLLKQPIEDVETLIYMVMKKMSDVSPGLPKSKFFLAMANVKLSAKFLLLMLTQQENKGPAEKKSKSSRTSNQNIFSGESTEQWTRRLLFAIEFLLTVKEVPISADIFSQLFTILKCGAQENCLLHQQEYLQQLILSLLIKLLQRADSHQLTEKSLNIEYVVEILRTTKSHQMLRETLRLLTVATRVVPSCVIPHVMAVFTFMGSGLLRKDNELTLGIIEDSLEALFGAIINGPSQNNEDASIKFIEISKVFASSIPHIPAHRRARLANAIRRSIPIKFAWMFPAILYERFCATWQRTNVTQQQNDKHRFSDQEAFDDLCIEMCLGYNGVEQIKFLLDLLGVVVNIGTDFLVEKQSSMEQLDSKHLASLIFDRSKHSLPKLRHYRFVILTVVVKILSSPTIYEKLSEESNEELLTQLLPIGHQFLLNSVEIDEFVQKGLDEADKNKNVNQNVQNDSEIASAQRYWIAVGTRTDIICDKLRHLFPTHVSAQLISEILNDRKASFSLKEKALALCNAKLLHDGFHLQSSIDEEEQLLGLISTLNDWIGAKNTKESIVLCQNSAYTLRLIAKRLSSDKQYPLLTTTMHHCVSAIQKWRSLEETMIGNLLLLAGELIRTHNMGTTMLNAEPLLKGCLAILESEVTMKRVETQDKPPSEPAPRKRRVRLMSLSGRPKGNDAMLICALTCIQRILDKFASFVSPYFYDIILYYSKLSARFVDPSKEKEISQSQLMPSLPQNGHQQASILKNTVQYRLEAIKRGLLKVEFRIILEPLIKVVKEINNNEKPLCVVFVLLTDYFEQRNFSWILACSRQIIADIFLPAFQYRMTFRKPEEFEMASRVEKAIFNSFVSLAEMFNENQLKPIFNQIIEWGEEAFSNDADIKTRLRMVTLLHLANHVYASFNALAMPYFHHLIELSVRVLRSCNATTKDTNALFLSGKRNSIEGLETDLLLTEAIDLIRNCAKHKEFFTEERSDLVSGPLINELDNTKCSGHEKRCVPHLADAIYQVAEAHPSKFANMLNEILLKTRNNKPKNRYRILLVLEQLFDRIGDSIAPHLPMVTPFLSELLEDENKNVEEQCDRVVRLLQRKFGAELSQGFS